MSRIALSLLLLFLGAANVRGDAKDLVPRERLRPSGLEGAVMLLTGTTPSERALGRFCAAASGDDAVIVVVPLLDAEPGKLVQALKAKKPAKLSVVVPTGSRRPQSLLGDATGVWILSGGAAAPTVDFLRDTGLGKELTALRLRGGVIAATGVVGPVLGTAFVRADGTTKPGLGILPGIALAPAAQAEALVSSLEKAPGMLGISLGDDTTLLMRGREVRNLGDGQVAVHLPRSSTRPARTTAIRGDGQVDYNEIRRAARARAEADPYPPRQPPAPEVPKGSLVIVGGGGMPADISKRFFELGKGAEGTFIVLPISNPDPLPANSGDGFLRRLGAKNIVVIGAREQKELEEAKNIEALKKATAVWFGGGRQWRFMDAYEGTKVEQLFRDVLARGGVIGGSSAGATIQGDYLCRGAPGGPNIMMCEGYEQGLRFLPGVAIDQHFTQRKRFPDMVALMKTYPQFLGIGLDEATAIVVQGHIAEVMGRGQVHFYDRRKPVVEDQPDHESLSAGTRYDLKKRQTLPAK